MKKDKAKLSYHDRPQYEHCRDLLSFFCSKVYISRRKDQNIPAYKNMLIHDLKRFQNIGPLAGILSAMHKHPKAAWLVLGCDLPFVNDRDLGNLIKKRDQRQMATAYRSVYDRLPEPLCAVYEPKAKSRMLSFFRRGTVCPRKIMINSDVKLLKPLDRHSLDNVNDPREYRLARAALKRGRKR